MTVSVKADGLCKSFGDVTPNVFWLIHFTPV